jgi:hypothetical protein
MVQTKTPHIRKAASVPPQLNNRGDAGSLKIRALHSSGIERENIRQKRSTAVQSIFSSLHRVDALLFNQTNAHVTAKLLQLLIATTLKLDAVGGHKSPRAVTETNCASALTHAASPCKCSAQISSVKSGKTLSLKEPLILGANKALGAVHHFVRSPARRLHGIRRGCIAMNVDSQHEAVVLPHS